LEGRKHLDVLKFGSIVMLDRFAIPGQKPWAWIGWVACLAAMAGLGGWEVSIAVLGWEWS
jgi:hypothetical protein